MKTIKLNAVMATMFAAGSLLLSVPVISNAEPGQGWDAFNAGASNEGVGENIRASAYLGAAMQADAGGQGWDAFNAGARAEGVGEPLPSYAAAYQGTSLEEAPSGDADVFRAGIR